MQSQVWTIIPETEQDIYVNNICSLLNYLHKNYPIFSQVWLNLYSMSQHWKGYKFKLIAQKICFLTTISYLGRNSIHQKTRRSHCAGHCMHSIKRKQSNPHQDKKWVIVTQTWGTQIRTLRWCFSCKLDLHTGIKFWISHLRWEGSMSLFGNYMCFLFVNLFFALP